MLSSCDQSTCITINVVHAFLQNKKYASWVLVVRDLVSKQHSNAYDGNGMTFTSTCRKLTCYPSIWLMSALGWLESSPTTVDEVTCILILADELYIEVYTCVRITQFWIYKTTLETVDCGWIWFIYTSYSGLFRCSLCSPSIEPVLRGNLER